MQAIKSTVLSYIKTYSLVLISLTLFTACGGDNQDDDLDDVSNSGSATVLDEQKISAQNVFNTIAGRPIVMKLVAESGAEYNAQALNNPDNVTNYSLESSKALNLGAYGSDLNVTSVFEQSQESMLFLKCVNMLAKDLGVSNCFDEKMIDRMEANKERRDSTLEIISQAFRNADNFLKANGRPGTSSLIVAGVWIEGMYLACFTAKETNSTGIVKEIFNQKESLTHLIELLESAKVAEDAKYVTTDLINLKKIFDAKIDSVFTLDALKELDGKITELRTKVVEPK